MTTMETTDDKDEGTDQPPLTAKEAELKDTILRYLQANSNKLELPADTVKILEHIKSRGVELLEILKPYRHASIYGIRFMQEMACSCSGSKDVIEQAIEARWESLYDAQDFLGAKIVEFNFEQRNVEVTCAMSAFFAIGAIMRFVPEIILQTNNAKNSQNLGPRFIAFYEKRLSIFLDDNIKSNNAETFHRDVYAAYNEMKDTMPELYEGLRKCIGICGELMAPFDDERYSVSWTSSYYPAGSEEKKPARKGIIIDFAKAKDELERSNAFGLSKEEFIRLVENGKELNKHEIDAFDRKLSDTIFSWITFTTGDRLLRNLIKKQVFVKPGVDADKYLQLIFEKCMRSNKAARMLLPVILDKIKNHQNLFGHERALLKESFSAIYWKDLIAKQAE
jgi:hypothetical protein